MKKGLIKSATRLTTKNVISNFIGDLKKSEEFAVHLAYMKRMKSNLEKFIKPGKSKQLNPTTQLIVLRKFNSYTPILPTDDDRYINKGGGYFIRFNKTGIVIDPGYNFVENFLKCGFRIDDIDHIFISHAHNDHTVELESIFALLFKRNKPKKGSKKKPKQVHLYMNLGTFKKFSGYFDLSKPDKNTYIKEITLLNRHQLIKVEDQIEVFTTRCKHHEMITRDYALGFTFRFLYTPEQITTIKFTSDTGWSKEIEEENQIEGKKFGVDEIDVLILHLGSIGEKELEYNINKPLSSPENKNKLYGEHLGIIGSVAEIDFWKPSIVILSEFGEELNAIRINIAKNLTEKMNTKVLPADLYLSMDIENLNIKCQKSGKFCSHTDITVDRKDQQIFYYNKANLNPEEEIDIQRFLGNSIKPY